MLLIDASSELRAEQSQQTHGPRREITTHSGQVMTDFPLA